MSRKCEARENNLDSVFLKTIQKSIEDIDSFKKSDQAKDLSPLKEIEIKY